MNRTPDTITITLAPWASMVRELLAWVLDGHVSIAAAARAVCLPSTTLATWARRGVPATGTVWGSDRRTPGYRWCDRTRALLGPGCAMVGRRGSELVIETCNGERVTVEISAVLAVLKSDPPPRTCPRSRLRQLELELDALLGPVPS